MNAKQLMISAAQLLYKEHNHPDMSVPASDAIVRKCLDYAKGEMAAMVDATDREEVSGIFSVLKWMHSQSRTQVFERNSVLSRMKSALVNNDRLFEMAEKGMVLAETPDKLLASIRQDRTYIASELGQIALKSEIKKVYQRVIYDSDKEEDLGGFLRESMERLSKIDLGGGREPLTCRGIISKVHYQDKVSLSEACDALAEVLSTEGVIRGPHKAFNRMLSDVGGIRRGDFFMLSAFFHGYKSGYIDDLYMGGALFNKPHLFNEKKKPLLLCLTAEDSREMKLRKQYIILKQLETNEPVIVSGVSPDYMSDYIHERLQDLGWEMMLFHIDPGDFTYMDLETLFDDLDEMGFETAFCMLDQLYLLNREGCISGASGDDLCDIFQKVRLVCLRRRIAFGTPHQLGPDALQQRRIHGDNDVIHHLPQKGYYMGSKTLLKVPDLAFIINKVTMQGRDYLQFAWEKHRDAAILEDKFKYFMIPFNRKPMYGLPYDVDKDYDVSVVKPIGAGDEEFSWD